MATPRFYAPDLKVGEVELDSSETHHLLNVRRLKSGDTCELFNGEGLSALATVEAAKKRCCRLIVEEPGEQDPVPGIRLTIAAPLPRAERARWLIEKLTELNVATFLPLVTEHSVSTARGGKADKHRQYIIDACKQSGRNTLMKLEEPTRLTALLATSVNGTLLAALRGGVGQLDAVERERTLVVGPEGGFSRSEVRQLEASGAMAVSFSPNILRLETAAIAGAVQFAA